MKRENRAGFTLLEMIVVIAILGILAGIATPVYSNYTMRAKEAADLVLLDAVNTAFAAACLENETDPASQQVADSNPKAELAGGYIMDVHPYGDAFNFYYGSNLDRRFQYYSRIRYKDGYFVGER